MANSIVCLIDCDPIKYASAATCEHKMEDGETIKIDPIEYLYANINSMVRKCFKRCDTKDYRCFLTPLKDGRNFRNELFPEYKANRIGKRKPYYIQDAHDYIKRRWRAQESLGQEADDDITIAHYAFNPFGFEELGETSVICSIDKDFNNVPGWHYNPRKDEFYFIDELTALKSFYFQMVTGDASDNVPRIKKGWRQNKLEEKIQKALTEKELYAIVYDEVYEVIYGGDKADQTRSLTRLQVDIEIKEWIIQQGQLLWLRTKPNELWRPKHEQV